MRLLTVHRLLIGSFVALALFYAAVQFRGDAPGRLARAAIAVTVAAASIVYLLLLNRRPRP